MYLEHKKLYRKPDIKMEVPLGLYEVEIGKGKIVKEGSDHNNCYMVWHGFQ
jgi:pyruvate/2-oxoglutarate/acetoin dehydrogenase E1 component